jgi:hypothetical protein
MRWVKFGVTILLALLSAIVPVTTIEAEVQKHEITTSKGLKMKLLVDETMDFIHAEILIFYKDKYTNPAVPALTRLNLFDRNVHKSDSGLLSTLKRLGHDYEVEQTADYIAIKINFLPDKLQVFARFLKSLYTYKPFLNMKINPDSYTYRKRQRDISRKFQDSVTNYWKYFYRDENWKRNIAYQIAYNKLFPKHSMGNTLITAKALKQATLASVRAFYQRVFRLPNSLLIIKGNFKLHMVRGYINSEFVSFKRQVPEVPVKQDLQINNERSVIVYNINSNEPPVLFWFQAIVPMNEKNYIPILVLNNILFGFPLGRINLRCRETGLNNLDIRSEVTNQQEVSVICNTISLRSREIEKFIRMADREKKRLAIGKVERREVLNTLSYFYGKTKVDTQYIDNDINHEILTSFYPFKQNDIMSPSAKSPRVTLAALNEHLENSNDFAKPNNGVIIIVGNYNSIRRYLKHLKPVIFNY